MADHAAVTTTNGNKYLDALIRAWRTLYTGWILDALVLIGAGLADVMQKNVDVTTEAFWITFWILVVKSFLTALGSFLLRLKFTPKNVTETKEKVPAAIG